MPAMFRVIQFSMTGLAVGLILTPGIAFAAEQSAEIPSAGVTCYAPTMVVAESGDYVYSWNLGTLGVTTSRFPSIALDPMTVDETTLERFALGLRPDPQDSDYEDWKAAATALLRPPTKTPGDMCISDVSATIQTRNYAGFVARAASDQIFDGVSASYTAPSMYPLTCNNSSIGQWVGVADSSTSRTKLSQVGLVYVPSLGIKRGFYEVVGGTWDTHGAVTFDVDFIDGHRYYMHIYYASAAAWNYSIVDLDDSTNLLSGSIPHTSGGTQYRGSAGLFISEVPDVLGVTVKAYMQHTVTRFRNSTVELVGGTSAKLADLNPTDFFMIGDYIAYTRGYADSLNATSSNFSEHWVAC